MRTFYHGTSTALNLGHVLLPANETNVLREAFRKKLRNVVFITTSKVSAERYAKKAAQRFGGEPVVYTVSLILPVLFKMELNGQQKRLIFFNESENPNDKSRTQRSFVGLIRRN